MGGDASSVCALSTRWDECHTRTCRLPLKHSRPQNSTCWYRTTGAGIKIHLRRLRQPVPLQQDVVSARGSGCEGDLLMHVNKPGARPVRRTPIAPALGSRGGHVSVGCRRISRRRADVEREEIFPNSVGCFLSGNRAAGIPRSPSMATRLGPVPALLVRRIIPFADQSVSARSGEEPRPSRLPERGLPSPSSRLRG